MSMILCRHEITVRAAILLVKIQLQLISLTEHIIQWIIYVVKQTSIEEEEAPDSA